MITEFQVLVRTSNTTKPDAALVKEILLLHLTPAAKDVAVIELSQYDRDLVEDEEETKPAEPTNEASSPSEEETNE